MGNGSGWLLLGAWCWTLTGWRPDKENKKKLRREDGGAGVLGVLNCALSLLPRSRFGGGRRGSLGAFSGELQLRGSCVAAGLWWVVSWCVLTLVLACCG